jgi:restriction endonuclease S subunit
MVIKPGKLASDFLVETDDVSWTTEKDYFNSNKGQLESGDILLLSAAHKEGYIGKNTSIFIEDKKKAMHIGELIRMKPDKNIINPYYLLAYLNNHFMKTLLIHSVRGQTVHLYSNDINNLPVILPPRGVQDSIGDRLKISIEKKIEAKKKKQEIGEIFAKFLPMDFVLPTEISYTYNIKEASIINKRLDAHFYHPKYKYNIRLINEAKVPKKKLDETVSFLNVTFNPEKLGEQKFKYVEIDNISLNYGYIDAHSEVPGKEAPSRARKILRENNLVIPLTRPYRGAIGVVDNLYDNCIGTTGFSVSESISKDVDTYYICAFLKTKFGIMQIEQRMSNSNYPAVIESNLRDILIPMLSDSEKLDISNNIKLIISLSRESQRLHLEAMSELEQHLSINGGNS